MQLWLKCEYYRHFKTEEVEKDIIKSALNLELNSKYPSTIQIEVFQLLNSKFFPLFKKSDEYEELLHDITRQQIYTHRIMQTSLGGDGAEIHISYVN